MLEKVLYRHREKSLNENKLIYISRNCGGKSEYVTLYKNEELYRLMKENKGIRCKPLLRIITLMSLNQSFPVRGTIHEKG